MPYRIDRGSTWRLKDKYVYDRRLPDKACIDLYSGGAYQVYNLVYIVGIDGHAHCMDEATFRRAYYRLRTPVNHAV